MVVGHDITPRVDDVTGADGVPALCGDIDLHYCRFILCNHRFLFRLYRSRRLCRGCSRGCRGRTASIACRGCCSTEFPAREEADTEDEKQYHRQRSYCPGTKASTRFLPRWRCGWCEWCGLCRWLLWIERCCRCALHPIPCLLFIGDI